MTAVNPELLRNVLEGLDTGLYVINPAGKILLWNDGAESITGYLRHEMLGRTSFSNFLGQTDSEGNELAGELSPVSMALRNGKTIGSRISLRHKEGHRVQVRVHTFPVRDERGGVAAVAESFDGNASMAEWDRRQGKLGPYGCLDPASGLLNHGMIQSHLREILGTFAEHPVPFSVVCFEIDHLDQIQTRDGPGATASVLRVVGQAIESSLRPTISLAGGKKINSWPF